jgi:hypothetical protein
VTTTQDELRGALFAVSPDGTVKWTARNADRAIRSSTPAILPDGTLVTMQVSVYVGTVDGYDPKDGTHTFSQPHGFVYPYNVFPVVGQDGTFYVSTDAGFQAFDAAGSPASTKVSSGSPNDLPAAIGGDGTLYTAASVDKGWWEVEATRPDGTRAWTLKDVSAQTFAVGSDGTVYASAGQALYAITAQGNVRTTSADFASPISSLLALDASDDVLFGTEDGKVHARGL